MSVGKWVVLGYTLIVTVAFSLSDNIIKRVFNIIKFTWVLFQTTVESFTKWMNDMCREYLDISTVLRLERCMLTREVKKVIVCDSSQNSDLRRDRTCVLDFFLHQK